MTYLTDAEAFARDLTFAANAQDWARYRNIQAQLAAETAQAILAEAALADKGRRDAIESVTESHPDFDQFYGSDAYKQVLADRRALLRHTSLATTLGHYVKVVPEVTQRAMDQVQELFSANASRQ